MAFQLKHPWQVALKAVRAVRQRFRRQPQVGIAVIVHRDGQFLFGLRKKTVGFNTYQLPGGHLELYETFEQGATREVWEETGLRLKNVKFLTITNNPWPQHKKHYITVFMTADAEPGDVTVMHSNWEWHRHPPEPLFESNEVFDGEEFNNYLSYLKFLRNNPEAA